MKTKITLELIKEWIRNGDIEEVEMNLKIIEDKDEFDDTYNSAFKKRITKEWITLDDHRKEENSWLEERERMATLLFKAGINSW